VFKLILTTYEVSWHIYRLYINDYENMSICKPRLAKFFYGLLCAFKVHIMACYAFYCRAIMGRYGAYCLNLYVWDTDGHMLAYMMSVSYREAPPLLTFGWVCHSFSFIYMYSRHTIIWSYHAYLNSRRPNVSQGDYLSFSFR